MTDFVFANNINTTLSAAITAGATTATVTDASKLPSLTGGKTLVLTLLDAATKSNFEVVYCTAISGTTLTIARGQEGTTAQAYGSGDYVWGAPTAGILQTFLQTADYATNPQSLAGTALNVAANPAGVAAFVGQSGLGKSANQRLPNTGTVNLDDYHVDGHYRLAEAALTAAGGTQNLTAYSDGQLVVINGDNADTMLQIISGYGNGQVMWRSCTVSGAASTHFKVVWDDGNFNPADYLTTTGTAANSSQLQGYSASHFTTYGDFTTSHTTPGYQRLANGLLIQWGEVGTGAQTGTTSFPTAFGANPLSILMTQTSGSVLDKYTPTVTGWNSSSFTWRMGSNYTSSENFFWLAIGY